MEMINMLETKPKAFGVCFTVQLCAKLIYVDARSNIIICYIYHKRGIFLNGFGAETISGILAIGKVMAKF